jgi:hypothetical protein
MYNQTELELQTRGLFYPMLTLTALLLVGVGLLLVRPNGWWPAGPRRLSDILQLAAPMKPATASQPHAGKSGTETMGTVAARHTRPIETETSIAKSAVRGLAEKRYPFPLAEQIANGTPQVTILAAFGPPEVKVTGADRLFLILTVPGMQYSRSHSRSSPTLR